MNYLTLLLEGEIHPAPGQKVIPANEFSKLLSAQELVDKARADGEEYKKQVAEEAEKQKQQAVQEGFDSGLAKWAEQIAHLEKTLETKMHQMDDQVGQVALIAAKKVVGRALEIDKTLVADVVASALKPVVHHTTIQIFVNKADLDAVEAARPKLKGLFDRLKSLTVAPRDDVQPGGCIIETEAGIINAQLDQLWKSLETAFQSLASNP
jgi:type III secretion protein L